MPKIACVSFLVAAFLIFISCKSSKQTAKRLPLTSTGSQTLKKKYRAPLADFACKQLKVPYKWGGNSPKGFDCSGFTSYCYAYVGVPLPRTAIEQSAIGKKIRSRKAKTGDLIFFKGSDKNQKIVAHVGIVLSGRKSNIKFIHVPSKGVMINQLSEEYYRQRFKTIRRVKR